MVDYLCWMVLALLYWQSQHVTRLITQVVAWARQRFPWAPEQVLALLSSVWLQVLAARVFVVQTYVWYLYRPIARPSPTAHPAPSLLGLPAELRPHIYQVVFQDTISSGDPQVLSACRQLYHELGAEISLLRASIVHVVSAAKWRPLFDMARDQTTYQALSSSVRRAVDIIKFIDQDAHLYNRRPNHALATLFIHGIRPSKVILHNSFSPHPAGHEIDALAQSALRISGLISNISHVYICNVPQPLVVWLGNQILNFQFVPNMKIQQMSNDLVAAFAASGGVCIDVAATAPVSIGGPQRPVTIHITILVM